MKSLVQKTMKVGTSYAREQQLIHQQKHYILSHFPNIAYNVVTIATSLGGLKTLEIILSALPADFPAAIIIVQHLSSQYPSSLPSFLNRCTSLSVKAAEAGDILRPANVYVAVPDKHLVVNLEGSLSFSDAPRMNFVRPAADKLFSSVATSFRQRAIGVVLTGRGNDGLLGAIAIKKQGGLLIAQDEATSKCFEMPRAVIETGKVDFVLPVEAIAPTLIKLIMSDQRRSQSLF